MCSQRHNPSVQSRQLRRRTQDNFVDIDLVGLRQRIGTACATTSAGIAILENSFIAAAEAGSIEPDFSSVSIAPGQMVATRIFSPASTRSPLPNAWTSNLVSR